MEEELELQWDGGIIDGDDVFKEWVGWRVVLVLRIWWIWEFFVYTGSPSTGVKSMPAIGGYVFPMGMVTVVGYVDG